MPINAMNQSETTADRSHLLDDDIRRLFGLAEMLTCNPTYRRQFDFCAHWSNEATPNRSVYSAKPLRRMFPDDISLNRVVKTHC